MYLLSLSKKLKNGDFSYFACNNISYLRALNSQIWPILDRELKSRINLNGSKFINSNASQDFLPLSSTACEVGCYMRV